MRSDQAWRRIGGLLILLLAPAPTLAQSISGGSVQGRVIDALGNPVFEAEITLQSQGSGALYRTVSRRGGEVQLSAIPPGDYDVRAEALGFRPQLVRGVPVRPGGSSRFTVVLEPEAPPVTQVDTVGFSGGAAGWIRPGSGRWLSRLDVADLPDQGRTLADLARLSTAVSEDLSPEGLPTRFTRFYIDGIAVEPARLPGTASDPLAALALTRSAFSGVEIVTGEPDVEWVDWGGAIISGLTRAGGDRSEVEAFGDFSGGGLWSSSALAGTVPSSRSIRGGASVSLPIVADTTQLVLGVEGWSTETPRPATLANPWSGSPAELASAYVEPFEAVSAFGRLDWALRGGNRFHIRANLAALRTPEPLGIGIPASAGQVGVTEGRDASVGATVFAGVARNMTLEARIGVEASRRASLGSEGLGGEAFPRTTLASVGIPIGTDPSLPAEVERTALTAAPTLHVDWDEHQLKVGGRFVVPRYSYTAGPDRAGSFLFGGPSDLARGEGAWLSADPGGESTSFNMVRFVGFAQDHWAVAPGFDITFGVQTTTQQLPESRWNTGLVWDSLTALGSDSVSSLSGLGTRFGFLWDVAQDGVTVLRGSVGLSMAPVDPTDIYQLLVGDGRTVVEQAVAGLDDWPSAPSPADVYSARRVALLGPNLRMPRTARGSVGFSRSVGSGTSLHLGGVFRRTEFLQRMADANTALASGGTDQFGRPLYGPLAQTGSLLRSRASLNRRFPSVERAVAINSDGWSLYSAATIAVDRHTANSDFFGSYTYSKTEDNLIGARDGSFDAMVDPGLIEGSDPWAEGRSDFDVPHRLVAGVGLRLPFLEGGTLSALYRFRSGDPFTPGFRPGVDANADGADRNDPAFAGGPETGGALSEFGCTAATSGRPFERNACRGPAVQGLDVRLRVAAFRVGNQVAELTLDALNLIEAETGVRDAALYLVDETQTLSQIGAETVVPLTANAGFGDVLLRRDAGRYFRIGLRIGGAR
ncbi:MAG: carboxypeptidase-like regulatory domain-containing protein [Gemmatimonadota bacterium]